MLNSDLSPPVEQTSAPITNGTKCTKSAPISQGVEGTRNTRLRAAAMLLPPLVGCVVVDQVTKQWATATLKHGETLSFWGDRFRLQYAMNSGGFLSLGSEFSEPARFALFIGFNLVLMCGLGWYFCAAPRAHRGMQFGVGLLFAGGIGNLIDRLTQNGQVIDFMNVGLGSVRTGIFNVADVAIVVGAVLVASGSWTASAGRSAPQP